MKLTPLLFLTLCIIGLNKVFAQSFNFTSFDVAIKNKQQIGLVYDSLEQIKQTAQKTNNGLLQAKCWYYQLQINDIIKEDTFYFKNSSFIDSIICSSNKNIELKMAMYVLQAKRLINFKQQFFNNTNKNNFSVGHENINYALLSKDSINQLITLYFSTAIELSKKINPPSYVTYLWLASNPLVFLVKPTIADIIYVEKLNVISVQEVNRKANKSWLFLRPTSFLDSITIPSINTNYVNPIFACYKEWANCHDTTEEAFHFIAALAKKHFATTGQIRIGVNSIYEQYLIANTNSTYNSIKVMGIDELANYWKTLGDKYYNKNYWYGYKSFQNAFDTTYRYYYAKSIDMIDKHSILLDSFFYIKQFLNSLGSQIKKPECTVSGNSIYLPTDSISFSVEFKNIKCLHYKFVALSSQQYLLNDKNFFLSNSIAGHSFEKIDIPISNDYQLHKTSLSFTKLPLGFYVFIYSSDSLNNPSSQKNYQLFQVTNTSVVNNDSRVFVLNRTTGVPIVNSAVTVEYDKNITKNTVQYFNTITNKNGYCIVDKKNIHRLIVFNKADTFITYLNTPEASIPDDVFDKEEEDLQEYYEDNIKLHLFTDRAIYRPGQTVFYKGIVTIKNPTTGEPLVLNKQNLQYPWLKKLFNKEIKLFAKGGFELYIKDPFYKTVDTINVVCNKYGSFTGKYIISKNAPTGEWEFDTDGLDIENSNSGSFKVEEYKRPAFELKLQKPNNFLQLGDSFIVKAMVKSFAGTSLNGVTLDYQIDAEFSYTVIDSITKKPFENYTSINLVDTTVLTNNNGEFFIQFPATFLQQYQFNNEKFKDIKYNLSVEAIDQSGESHEENLRITLDNRPVKIKLALDNVYEKNALSQLNITTKSVFSGALQKTVSVKLYKLSADAEKLSDKNELNDYIYSNKIWTYYYPTTDKEATESSNLIYTINVNTGSEKFTWPKHLLQSGNYKMEATCIEKGSIVGFYSGKFSVFDFTADELPNTNNSFSYLPINTVSKGDTIQWYTGQSNKNLYTIFHAQYYTKTKKGIELQQWYSTKQRSTSIHQLQFIIPNNAIGYIQLTELYIYNNQLFTQFKTVYVNEAPTSNPEIIVEQYRKILTPGSKETFVVSIKTNNENIAAELMTTMYDASLDKIEKHKWNVPDQKNRFYNRINWDRNINISSSSKLFQHQNIVFKQIELGKEIQPLWWLNPLDYAYNDVGFSNNLVTTDVMSFNMLSGKIAGVDIKEKRSLKEVVVTSAVGVNKIASTSHIIIRGTSSLNNDNIPLLIVDGKIYEGDINAFNANLISDIIVLKGADATALYGAKAANGVIIISTNGPVQLPEPIEPPVVVRKNFSETAFFFPQVHANANGMYVIDFEIPESVTEWNWKMLAHTKAAQFLYTQRTIHTQLPLMVQPNMPRFLFEGDEIKISTRITNLDTVDLQGTSTCTIEDVTTGVEITSQIIGNNKNTFTVNKQSNNSIDYVVKIPLHFIHPLKIKITARAGSFSDGEEYIIPILSKKILVTQNVPFALSNQLDTILQTPTMPADAAAVGVGLYITPKPQAALINALPYLANYPYNCAEQTFNKMFANSVALHIFRTDTAAQKNLALAKTTDITNQALPTDLQEETMPWLQLNHANTIQQQKLRMLFDTNITKANIEKYLDYIIALQNSDGGIAWFTGGKSSYYISCYLLANFGKLQHDALPILLNTGMQKKHAALIKNLLNYCAATSTSYTLSFFDHLQYLEARKQWIKEYPVDSISQQKIDSFLQLSWQNIHTYDLNTQAIIIGISHTFKGRENVFYKNAIAQLASIQQLANYDAINGYRWKTLSNSDDFNGNDEEAIANLTEAFSLLTEYKPVVDGIITWLLQAKEHHYWQTTKATAAIISILNKQLQKAMGLPVTISSTNLSVTDNLLEGQQLAFVPVNSFEKNMPINKSNNNIAKGGINYYYFTANPPLNIAQNDVLIKRQIQRYQVKTNTWEDISDTTILHIADKLTTTITITTKKPLQYIFINEKRAAGLEPANNISGYKYQHYFSYYESVRDFGYQFFAENIPSGISNMSYETIVAKEGVFSNGVVELQCMYKPNIRAYGGGGSIKIIR